MLLISRDHSAVSVRRSEISQVLYQVFIWSCTCLREIIFMMIVRNVDILLGRIYRKSSTLGAVRTPLHRKVQLRRLHRSSPRCTDGVYKALTEMRVRIPFIEALRNQKTSQEASGSKLRGPATPSHRDMSPKSMSESYHRVVRQ